MPAVIFDTDNKLMVVDEQSVERVVNKGGDVFEADEDFIASYNQAVSAVERYAKQIANFPRYNLFSVLHLGDQPVAKRK